MFVAEKPGSYKYEQQQSRNSCVEDVRDVEGIGVWERYCEEERHWLLELWHICFVFYLVYEFCTQRCRRSNWIKKKLNNQRKIISKRLCSNFLTLITKQSKQALFLTCLSLSDIWPLGTFCRWEYVRSQRCHWSWQWMDACNQIRVLLHATYISDKFIL